MQFDYRTNDPILSTHEPTKENSLMKQTLFPMLPPFIRRRIERSEMLQRIVGNVGWLFFDKVLRMGVGLLVTAWVARYLGPEQYGIWNYAIAFAALFGTFATLGLDGIVVREVVKNPSGSNEILGSAFVLKLGGGVLALAISVGLIAFWKPNDSLTFYLVVITAGTFLCQSFDAIDLFFQSQVRSKYSVLAKDASFVVVSLVRIALILFGATVIAFAGAGLAEAVLGALFLVVTYRMRGESVLQWRVKVHAMRAMLRDSWPLILSGLVIMVYMRIDQIMIGEMVGKAAVGTYAAAVRISEIWYFIPVAVASSMYPAILELRNSNPDRYRLRLQQLYDMLTWLSFGGALVVSLSSGIIINLLYGTEYHEAAGILIIHIWTGVFVSLGVASGKYLLAENLTRIAFYRSLSGAVANVLANLALIPRYGAAGAAIATLLSQVLAGYLFDITSSSTRSMFFMKSRSILFINVFKTDSQRNV